MGNVSESVSLGGMTYRDNTLRSSVPSSNNNQLCLDSEFPQITLAEMMDDLDIGEDATGGEGAPMLA